MKCMVSHHFHHHHISYRKRQPTSVVTGSDYTEVQSSELKHRRGDATTNRRDNHNKLNFSNFEDVEKEREELKREKKSLQENVRNSPKIEKEKRYLKTYVISSLYVCLYTCMYPTHMNIHTLHTIHTPCVHTTQSSAQHIS